MTGSRRWGDLGGEVAPVARTKARAGAERDDDLAFEEALGELEKIVARLEKGEEPLESALGLFEEGVRLARVLTTKLDEAQARIDKVVAESGGGTRLEPFEAADLGGEEGPRS